MEAFLLLLLFLPTWPQPLYGGRGIAIGETLQNHRLPTHGRGVVWRCQHPRVSHHV